jgi:hypothetical protein
MSQPHKALQITGFVLHFLIAALLLMGGFFKIAGLMPAEAVAEMKKSGIGDHLLLIGWGETIAAILMLIPRTSPLGTLLVSGFWGGVICTHLIQRESFVVYSVFLAVTWIAAEMRGCIKLFLPTPVDTKSDP